MPAKTQAGFNLIELMVTLLLMALIAGLALPGYQSVVRKSRRIDAVATLAGIQLRQAKWRATHDIYATLAEIGAPPAEQARYYEFSVSSVTDTTFTVLATARAASGQDRDTQNGSSCAVLSVNQSNERSPAACWR